MSELSDMKRSIDDLKDIVVKHISDSNAYIAGATAYREERDKVVDALTATVWDKDGKPGVATKVDRLEQVEAARKWTIRAIAAATIAGITDKFLHVLPK